MKKYFSLFTSDNLAAGFLAFCLLCSFLMFFLLGYGFFQLNLWAGCAYTLVLLLIPVVGNFSNERSRR